MSTPARHQCEKCPWKVTTDPYDIPDGYDVDAHHDLQNTIAQPSNLSGLFESMHVMACHESNPGGELPCVGWMSNQLGPGNNLSLRLAVMSGRIDGNVQTVGRQHLQFEDTLP